jgi:hypothetical protein
MVQEMIVHRISNMDAAWVVEAARLGVWAAWGGALVLFGLKLVWRWLDSLTSFGKTTTAPPARPHRLLGFSSRVVFTAAYAGGSLLNALLLLLLLFISFPHRHHHHTQWWYLVLGPLLQVHLLRRLCECVWVHRFSPRPVSDANAAFAGAYYAFVCLGPWVEFVADAWAADSSSNEAGHVDNTLSSLIMSLCGCCLFFYASWHQHVCHRILAELRSTSSHAQPSAPSPEPVKGLIRRGTTIKKNAATMSVAGDMVSAPGQEGRYGLPTGDWFDYVSSPHYLAEILIYVAFVMMTGGRVVCLWLILGFVVANLTRSALQTHRWYTDLFPSSLPKHRRALFPHVL